MPALAYVWVPTTSNWMTSTSMPPVALRVPGEVVPSPQEIVARAGWSAGAMALKEPTLAVKAAPADSWIVTPPGELGRAATIALLWISAILTAKNGLGWPGVTTGLSPTVTVIAKVPAEA